MPLIRTIIQIRSSSDITLQDTRMMRERGGASTSAVVEAEAVEVVVDKEGLKPKRWKVKGTTKTHSHAKPKPLRRVIKRRIVV